MKESKKGVIVLIIIFLIGFGIFAYPLISNLAAEKRAEQRVGDYVGNVSHLSEEVINEQWIKVEAYNNALIGEPVKDPFIPGSGAQLPQNYLEVLNVSDVMAYIEIPKINVKLPIYHGVSDEVLSKGVGHMEGTSFPIGGEGTHCLLTGHTGLPEAKLFTDLTKLEIGDQFYIFALDAEMVYQVDQINVIEPDELGLLNTEVDEDYITLITCTPYGVNSHRLLVRGTRVYQMIKSIELSKDYSWVYILLLVLSTIMSVILMRVCYRDYRRKKRLLSDIV